MFWIGMIIVIIFLLSSGISLGAAMLWLNLYFIIAGIIDFIAWENKHR